MPEMTTLGEGRMDAEFRARSNWAYHLIGKSLRLKKHLRISRPYDTLHGPAFGMPVSELCPELADEVGGLMLFFVLSGPKPPIKARYVASKLERIELVFSKGELTGCPAASGVSSKEDALEASRKCDLARLFELKHVPFVHEYIHFLDSKRVKRPMRDLALKPPADRSEHEWRKIYYNNPLEFNAHVQEYIENSERELDRQAKRSQEIRRNIVSKSAQEIISILLKRNYIDREFWSMLTDDNRRKFMKRFAQFWDEFVSSRRKHEGRSISEGAYDAEFRDRANEVSSAIERALAAGKHKDMLSLGQSFDQNFVVELTVDEMSNELREITSPFVLGFLFDDGPDKIRGSFHKSQHDVDKIVLQFNSKKTLGSEVWSLEPNDVVSGVRDRAVELFRSGKNVFVHEYIHLLDYNRVKTKKIGGLGPLPGKTAHQTLRNYFNNPLELNAWTQASINSVHDDLYDIVKTNPGKVESLISKSPIEIVNMLLDKGRISRDFWDNMSEENRRRFMKRFAQFWEKFVDANKKS